MAVLYLTGYMLIYMIFEIYMKCDIIYIYIYILEILLLEITSQH